MSEWCYQCLQTSLTTSLGSVTVNIKGQRGEPVCGCSFSRTCSHHDIFHVGMRTGIITFTVSGTVSKCGLRENKQPLQKPLCSLPMNGPGCGKLDVLTATILMKRVVTGGFFMWRKERDCSLNIFPLRPCGHH